MNDLHLSTMFDVIVEGHLMEAEGNDIVLGVCNDNGDGSSLVCGSAYVTTWFRIGLRRRRPFITVSHHRTTGSLHSN